MVRTVCLLTALLVGEIGASVPDRVRGEIALSDSPLCDFFVVSTDRSFSLLDWRGGVSAFAEGDRIEGPLTTTGVQAFVLDHAAVMRAEVEEVGVNLTRAQLAYYARCHEDTPDPPDSPGTVARR